MTSPSSRVSRSAAMAARTAARFVQRRLLSSGGKVLGEEEKAAENVYIKVQISPLPPSLPHSSAVLRPSVSDRGRDSCKRRVCMRLVMRSEDSASSSASVGNGSWCGRCASRVLLVISARVGTWGFFF